MGDRIAARTAASRSAGQTISTRCSRTVSRRPAWPTAGLRPLVAEERAHARQLVNEHSSYAPIRPAPAANAAARTASRSDPGVKTTTLNEHGAADGRSGPTSTRPSRRARPSLIPPAVLSNAVCGLAIATPARASVQSGCRVGMVGPDPLDRPEQDRMMAHDQLGPLVDRLGGRRGRHGQAGHDPRDLGVRIAPEQAHVVPGLGQPSTGANSSSQRATSATVVIGVPPRFEPLGTACRPEPAGDRARARGSVPRPEPGHGHDPPDRVGQEDLVGPHQVDRDRLRAASRTSRPEPPRPLQDQARMIPGTIGPSQRGVTERSSTTRKRFVRLPSQSRPSGVMVRHSSKPRLRRPRYASRLDQ